MFARGEVSWTLKSVGEGEYVGVDLTDGTLAFPRAIDVCGLRREGDGLCANFWTWTVANGGPSNVAALLPEVRTARGVVIDGPQALADVGKNLRDCERELRTPGRTPDSLASAMGPFSGFVRSSVDLFSAFQRAGVSIGPLRLSGAVAEQYPGANWKGLAGLLPLRSTSKRLYAKWAEV